MEPILEETKDFEKQVLKGRTNLPLFRTNKPTPAVHVTKEHSNSPSCDTTLNTFQRASHVPVS